MCGSVFLLALELHCCALVAACTGDILIHLPEEHYDSAITHALIVLAQV